MSTESKKRTTRAESKTIREAARKTLIVQLEDMEKLAGALGLPKTQNCLLLAVEDARKEVLGEADAES